ncbi:hypothetical protein WMF18_41795 [Sorangium sp. So ce315]|uniref:hypothetical protein n=1 Tax=Sorangium sp. So ce315 TaxID=3133299 RepID=UPI003F5F9DCA
MSLIRKPWAAGARIQVLADQRDGLALFDYVLIEHDGGKKWLGQVVKHPSSSAPRSESILLKPELGNGAVDLIRKRAYFLHEERTGERWWDPASNWLEAERFETELAARHLHPVEIAVLFDNDLSRSDETRTLPPSGAIARKVSRTENPISASADSLVLAARLSRIGELRSHGNANIKGFAQELFHDASVAAQLRNIPHFGCLSTMESLQPLGSILSRHDYVAIHCALLFDAKLHWPGIGLSSPISKGSQISGLVACQSWAVLVNLGHLFGTFASERALFFLIARDPQVRHEIIKDIEMCNKELSQTCRALLEQRNLHRVFYVIASWRACKLLTGKRRRTCIELLNIFLAEYLQKTEDPHLRRLFWAYKVTRQMAYNIAHASVLTSVAADALFGHDLPNVVSFGSITFDEYAGEDSPLVRLMDAFDSYHADQTFASDEAVSLVLGHIRSFKRWWRTHETKSVAERLTHLFSRPADWSDSQSTRLKHFLRLKLVGEQDSWISEVRAWLRGGVVSDPWGESNFMITPSPRRSGLVCDIYAGAGGLENRTVQHVAGRLADQSVRSWSVEPPGEVERSLWRSVALFGARLFDAYLKGSLRLQLEPVVARGGHFGYAILAPSFEQARDRFEAFRRMMQDEERAQELGAAFEHLSRQSLHGVPCLLFVARTRIVTSDGNKVADVDGLFASFRDDGVEWIIMETKALAQAGAAGQLEQKVLSCVSIPTTPVQNHRTTTQKIACASFLASKNLSATASL